MKPTLVNKKLKIEQVAQIYNGTIDVEEETIYVVHIHPSDCEDCSMLHLLLLQAGQQMQDENVEVYSFCYGKESENPPIILQKLMGPTPKEHGCIMICTIKKGIRKKMTILTGEELDAQFPPDLNSIPAPLLFATLKKLIIGDNL